MFFFLKHPKNKYPLVKYISMCYLVIVFFFTKIWLYMRSGLVLFKLGLYKHCRSLVNFNATHLNPPVIRIDSFSYEHFYDKWACDTNIGHALTCFIRDRSIARLYARQWPIWKRKFLRVKLANFALNNAILRLTRTRYYVPRPKSI